jgi:hypothetical protein
MIVAGAALVEVVLLSVPVSVASSPTLSTPARASSSSPAHPPYSSAPSSSSESAISSRARFRPLTGLRAITFLASSFTACSCCALTSAMATPPSPTAKVTTVPSPAAPAATAAPLALLTPTNLPPKSLNTTALAQMPLSHSLPPTPGTRPSGAPGAPNSERIRVAHPVVTSTAMLWLTASRFRAETIEPSNAYRLLAAHFWMSGLVAGEKAAFRGLEVSRRVCKFVRTRRRVSGGGKLVGWCRRRARRWGKVCLVVR